MAKKPLWTPFFDGLIGEGLFGDLRLPGTPTRMFKPEPQVAPAARPILVIVPEQGANVPTEEVVRLRALVQHAIDESAEGRVRIIEPDATERYAAG